MIVFVEEYRGLLQTGTGSGLTDKLAFFTSFDSGPRQ